MNSIGKNSEAKLRANKNYDDKTYKRYALRLRVEDDKKIIDSKVPQRKKPESEAEHHKEKSKLLYDK